MTTLVLTTLILIAATIDDLKTKKVHNWLTIPAMFIGLLSHIFVFGGETSQIAGSSLGDGSSQLLSGAFQFTGIQFGNTQDILLSFLGAACATILYLPAWLLKWLKAGDVKLMIAVGFTAGHEVVIAMAIYSLLWGAVFGLAQAILKGQLKNILRNVSFLIMMRRSEGLELHMIPYTVPLIFAWLTVLKLDHVF